MTRRYRRYNPHAMTKTEVLGWIVVGLLGALILGTLVFGSVYISACSVHGINMCH